MSTPVQALADLSSPQRPRKTTPLPAGLVRGSPAAKSGHGSGGAGRGSASAISAPQPIGDDASVLPVLRSERRQIVHRSCDFDTSLLSNCSKIGLRRESRRDLVRHSFVRATASTSLPFFVDFSPLNFVAGIAGLMRANNPVRLPSTTTSPHHSVTGRLLSVCPATLIR